MFDLEREKEGYPAFDPIHCPDGLIDISSAKNTLMVNDLRSWCEKNRDKLVDDVMGSKFSYSLIHGAVYANNLLALEYGATAGSHTLRAAIAKYTTRHFKTAQIVSPDSIIVGNGVSSLLGTLAYNICDANEGIMLEVPNYGMFGSDLTYQTSINLVRVYTGELPDRFSETYATQLIYAYERSFQDAVKNKITIKAVLVCNPCNPVGRCYSQRSLQKIAQFCTKYNLHLISDEIYALSSGTGTGGLDGFTSVLSLPNYDGVCLENIHVLSGASKDFGLGGLRLGWIITRNELLWQTVRRLA